MKSRFAALSAAMLLHGCSGGGNQNNGAFQVSPDLSPASITSNIYQYQLPGAFVVSYQQEGSITTQHPFYIVLDDDGDTFVTGLLPYNQEYSGTVINYNPTGTDQLSSLLPVRNDLSLGSHSGTLTLHFCHDSGCHNPIGMSQLPYSVNFLVDPPVSIQSISPNPILDGAVAGATVGVVMELEGTLGSSEQLYARLSDPSGNFNTSALVPVQRQDLRAYFLMPLSADVPAKTLSGTVHIDICRTADCSILADSTSLPYTLHVFELLAGSPENRGQVDGPGSSATFLNPSAMAYDSLGNAYVSDGPLRKIDAGGNVSTPADLQPASGDYFAIDSSNNFYGDSPSYSITKIAPDGSSSIVAGGSCCDFFPNALSVGADGTGYVIDGYTIQKFPSSGDPPVVAGVSGQQGEQDGQGAAALLYGPGSIKVAPDGTVYFSDGSALRKMTPTYDVTTVAGQYNDFDTVDGSGANARFELISGLDTGPDGTVYVLQGNNQIRTVSQDGTVSTFLSEFANVSGPGVESQASLRGFAVSSDGKTMALVGDFAIYRTQLAP